jgi:hypothetical protein
MLMKWLGLEPGDLWRWLRTPSTDRTVLIVIVIGMAAFTLATDEIGYRAQVAADEAATRQYVNDLMRLEPHKQHCMAWGPYQHWIFSVIPFGSDGGQICGERPKPAPTKQRTFYP